MSADASDHPIAEAPPSPWRPAALLTIALTIAATFAGWSLFSREIAPPPIDGMLHGVTYAPYGKDQDAMALGLAKERLALTGGRAEARPPLLEEVTGELRALFGGKVDRTGRDRESYERNKPRAEQIERDMRALAGRVRTVRTYSSLDGVEDVAKIADQYGLRVVAGAWIYDHVGATPDHREKLAYFKTETDREIAALIRLANSNPNIERVIIGNETILRGEISPARLIEYIRHVKKNVKVPVSTAEPWHLWLKHPELVKEVDFIAVHILPYWDKDAGVDGIAYLGRRIADLRAQNSTKNIVVTEVGWPSNGAARIGGTGDTPRGTKDASPALQARYIREAVELLRREKIDHFVIEAFDQPWKSRDLEGLAGGYWGLFDADRQQKFPWTRPVTVFAEWPALAAWTLALALPLVALFLWRWRGLRPAGELVFAGIAAASCAGIVYAVHVAAGTYMVWYQMVGWALLGAFLVLSLGMVLFQALELSETIFTRRWRREITPAMARAAGAVDRHWPKVSLHLAICNEPPAMVQETLDSLAALDYPNLEVIVVDNNTRDPAVWRPVEEHCKQLGERFRFFHFDVMKGFKAGALNHVLKVTAPDAEVIAVIDSDYVVRKDWLRSLVPQFVDPKIGYVQAPQDHRDWKDDRFKEMLQWEYAGFFDIGMCLRNEYDAIIQHGTMTLIRRKLMDDLGGWAMWCICEDSELGLRMMEKGYGAAYSRERFGQGLTPDNFSGYKKQRFRWAYGAMQILKGHWREILSNRTRLTFWQKYHFVTGWLPWFADALNVAFTVTGIAWALGFLFVPHLVPLPPAVFLVPTLALFGYKLAHSFALYAARVDCTFRQSVGASLAGLSLTYTVGKAVIYGLLTSKLPFIRTPKMDSRATIGMALAMARDEAVLTVALWAMALAVPLSKVGSVDPTARLWSALLVVQSLPYAAAVYVSLVNAMEQIRQSRALVEAPPPASASPTGAMAQAGG
ncbi:MAG: glycosyltransferase [Rhodospirillales bacterium]|nr:MAG: glycosyltransferase [Rhodospirillales bacterium]